MIQYKDHRNLDLDQVIALYHASTLGERRPIHNRKIMEAMLSNAPLIITAWHNTTLVGIARTLTDFHYVAYLADLAVHLQYQRQGIGKTLIEKTRLALAPTCFLALLAAPKAHEYYQHLGFTPHPRAWILDPVTPP